MGLWFFKVGVNVTSIKLGLLPHLEFELLVFFNTLIKSYTKDKSDFGIRMGQISLNSSK